MYPMGAPVECCFNIRSVTLHSPQCMATCVQMGFHMGGGGRRLEGGGKFQSVIWEQGETVLCLLPSAHTMTKLEQQ